MHLLTSFWMVAALGLVGCGADSAGDTDVDVTEVSPVPCSSISLDVCREDEQCVFHGSGSCMDWLGFCESIPSHCSDDWGEWRASWCGYVSYPSTCAARAEGRGGPLLLISTTTVGAECDPTVRPSECAVDETCVLVSVDGSGRPNGRCMSLLEVCRSSPVFPVCETHSASGSSYGECWDSPCLAWRSGYHGLLSVDR